MVATIHVLSEGFDGGYYTGGGATEYYASTPSLGRWSGSAAGELGLEGPVYADVFARVLVNRHPTKERQLIKKPKPAQKKDADRAWHRPGFDVTLSPMKSFSVAERFSPEPLQKNLFAAFDRADRATWDWVEKNLFLTRSGRNGKKLEKAKLVIAEFDHDTNRNGDLQRHRHKVLINACLSESGRWQTINSRELHNWVRTIGPILRCQLGAELVQLGYQLERAHDAQGNPQPWAEIVGVPKALCGEMSSRRDDIQRELAGVGVGLGRGNARARAHANKATRKKKDKSLSEDAIRARWRVTAAKHGFGEVEAMLLANRSAGRVVDAEAEYAQAWKTALGKLTETESCFPERRLIQFVFEELQASGIPIDKIFAWIQRDIALAKDIVQLDVENGEMQFSTRTNWVVEEQFLKLVNDLRGRSGHIATSPQVERHLAGRTDLSNEQREAVRKLTTHSSAIRTFTGVAGSGKSLTLDAVRTVLEAEGFVVLGAAISGAAKEELRDKANIPSRTVASLLYHLDKAEKASLRDRVGDELRLAGRSLKGHKKAKRTRPIVEITPNTVLFVDEAAMIGSKTLTRIARHVQRFGGTLILSGDHQQHQPIEAGGPFYHLCREEVTATLTENRRQQNRHDAQAVKDIREGNAERAITSYVRRGRLTIGENRLDTIHKLVDEWTRHGGAASPAEHFIFTQKRDEARLVNRLCQAERLAQLPYASTRGIAVDQERLYVGDRVLFHNAYRLAGIENGYRGTVMALDAIRRTITVQLDKKSMQNKRVAAVVTVPLDRLGKDGVTPGYAATSHKLQGGAVEHSYMLLGSMTNQNTAYVQATRGKRSTRLFVDKHHAGDELRELMADFKRARIKKLAHDLVRPKPEQTLRLQIES